MQGLYLKSLRTTLENSIHELDSIHSLYVVYSHTRILHKAESEPNTSSILLRFARENDEFERV